MYKLSARIEINGERRWTITQVSSVEIERDTDTLTDLCKITLPRRMLWDGMRESPVRRGDQVRVSLGYDNELRLLFVGYVREIGVKTPIVLICEDEMYSLKSRQTKPQAYRSVSVETLIRDQGYTGELRVLGEQSLGQYRVTTDTVASLLGKLRDQGIRVFFRLEEGVPVLYAGLLLEHNTGGEVQVVASGLNLIGDNQLEQQHADAMRLKIKVISHQRDNKCIRVEVGDQDGELRTLHTYGRSKAEAEAWGKEEYKRLKRDGLKGSLTTFCIRPLDKLDLIGVKLEGKRMGVYQVSKVTIKYGADGYHQTITLGQRIRD
ncbi:hypothetical protein [Porphyromonas loveana]